jgi:Fe-S-cluster containining protein
LITDLVRVRTLSEAKAAENLDFQRFVRQRNASPALFREIAAGVERQVDCTQCAACCRETYVDVSPADIHLIALHLGTTEENVMAQYTMVDPSDHRPVLKHVNGGCVFLDDNLCMIYGVRPGPCRNFPHLLNASNTLGHRLESIVRRAAYCPIVYNTLESYKHLLGYHHHPHQSK